MSSLRFRARERKSDMIGCPFCFPLFCCYGWHIPSIDAIPTLLQLPLASPPTQLQYNLISISFFVLTLPHWFPPFLCLRSTCSHLHLYLDNALIFHASFFFVLPSLFLSFFPISPSLFSCCFTSSRLGWPIFQWAVQWRQLDLCLQSAVGPQFLGQWDMLRKKSLLSFFPSRAQQPHVKGSRG